MGKGNRHLNFNKMWFSNFKQIHGMSTNVNSTTIKQKQNMNFKLNMKDIYKI
jgi:hypothetical protein